uniref:Uncharacterized protein n=1 Tax=Salix viminalis TaxID=40686 RepID=A0A6N2KDY5_SALVM
MAFKRTDEEDDCEVCPYMLTRVGEADLEKKVDGREAKLELEEAKAVEEARVRLVDLANLALLERRFYRDWKGAGCPISRDSLMGLGFCNLGFLLESLQV